MPASDTPPALVTRCDAQREPRTTSLNHTWGIADLNEALSRNSFILRKAEQLERSYGLPLSAGVVASCAAITAAAGPCYSFKGLNGETVHPAQHDVLVTNATAPVRMAVESVFKRLAGRVRDYAENLRASGDLQAAELGTMADNCFRDARSLERQADAERDYLVKSIGAELLAQYPDVVHVFATKERRLRKMAEVKCREALELAGTMAFALRPGILKEQMPATAWLAPEAASFDRALFNLDPGSCTWPSLEGERPALQKQVLQRLAAGLTGAPVAQEGVDGPGWLLSSLTVMSLSAFERLWNDDKLRGAGLRALLLPIQADVSAAGLPADVSCEDDGHFDDLLTALFRLRIFYSTRVTWILSPEAETTYLRFVRDLAQEPRPASEEVAGVLDTVPSRVLKLLILLRLGTQGGMARTDPIDGGEMRTAIALALEQARAAMAVMCSRADNREGTGGHDRAVEEMVGKIKAKGPLRRRELFRTYHRQKVALLLPVLERALALGLVVERDGMLLAASHSQAVSEGLPPFRSA